MACLANIVKCSTPENEEFENGKDFAESEQERGLGINTKTGNKPTAGRGHYFIGPHSIILASADMAVLSMDHALSGHVLQPAFAFLPGLIAAYLGKCLEAKDWNSVEPLSRRWMNRRGRHVTTEWIRIRTP